MGNLHVLILLNFSGYYTITELKVEDHDLRTFTLSVFVCFLRFQQHDVSPTSVDWFIQWSRSVLCAVRTEYLKVISINFSLKRANGNSTSGLLLF